MLVVLQTLLREYAHEITFRMKFMYRKNKDRAISNLCDYTIRAFKCFDDVKIDISKLWLIDCIKVTLEFKWKFSKVNKRKDEKVDIIIIHLVVKIISTQLSVCVIQNVSKSMRCCWARWIDVWSVSKNCMQRNVFENVSTTTTRCDQRDRYDAWAHENIILKCILTS